MIRQTTTIPVVEPPLEKPESKSGLGRWLFIALEVVLLGSIPVLGLLGFQNLLDTRSGEFAVEPGPTDAGWVAAVAASPLSILIDVDEGRVGGAVLVAPNGDDVDGGTIILISGATEIDGIALSDRDPASVVAVLEEALRLDLGVPAIADSEGWNLLLDGQSIELANPDPVVAEASGESDEDGAVDPAILIPAGRVNVGAEDLAALSTRAPIIGSDFEALEFRRDVLWRTLLDDATFALDLEGNATLAQAALHLGQIANGVHRIEALPLDGIGIDADATEDLIRSAVALPRGHAVGARLQVRIVDRSGDNDLEIAARNLGQAGFEVVQIANAVVFDDGATQLLASPTGAEAEIARLAELADAATVPPSLDAEAASVVTLLLGPDAEIAQSTQ